MLKAFGTCKSQHSYIVFVLFGPALAGGKGRGLFSPLAVKLQKLGSRLAILQAVMGYK